MTDLGSTLVVGLGVTNRAVVAALIEHGHPLDRVVVVDDRPSDVIRSFVAEMGVELVETPDVETIANLVARADCVLPAPGLPDHHPAMVAATERRARILSEFDLSAMWDDRPLVAVTGSDGKTTVTTMVAEMLEASEIPVALAGNNDLPLVAAISDPRAQLFVVEASSFRIGHSERFAPGVATWLNFAPDHLDVHASLQAYESAKAKLFADQPAGSVAIVNADDPVVMAHLGAGAARYVTFSAEIGDYRVSDGTLVTDQGERLIAVSDLRRRGPHDIANALAAAATARSAGARIDAIGHVLATFEGLPHRAQLIAEHDGIRFVNDSKATVPHAVIAAVRSEARSVLIAGGRNKGLDLGELAMVADRLVAVVAIGEAAGEVADAFAATAAPVHRAASMAEAVSIATQLAAPGETVLLSPGCASHDWYNNFAERGDDFCRVVRSLTTRTETA